MSNHISLKFRNLSKSDVDGNTVYFKWVGETNRLYEILFSLSEADSKEEIVSIIAKIRCFYAFVVLLDDSVVLCGDHLKTIPLYYSVFEGQVLIGDNFQELSKKFDSSRLSSEALLEMQILGYVLDEKTYIESINQVRAGEVLTINMVHGTVESLDHFMFIYRKPERNVDFLEHKFHRLIEESIGSLVRYANGRQIAIPLSGGYDSRLILSILSKTGYQNILCFTYGVKGNKESEEEHKGSNFYTRERFCGEFKRSLSLPQGSDTDKVDAEFKDGVLTLKISKGEVASSKTIKIQG